MSTSRALVLGASGLADVHVAELAKDIHHQVLELLAVQLI